MSRISRNQSYLLLFLFHILYDLFFLTSSPILLFYPSFYSLSENLLSTIFIIFLILLASLARAIFLLYILYYTISLFIIHPRASGASLYHDSFFICYPFFFFILLFLSFGEPLYKIKQIYYTIPHYPFTFTFFLGSLILLFFLFSRTSF